MSLFSFRQPSLLHPFFASPLSSFCDPWSHSSIFDPFPFGGLHDFARLGARPHTRRSMFSDLFSDVHRDFAPFSSVPDMVLSDLVNQRQPDGVTSFGVSMTSNGKGEGNTKVWVDGQKFDLTYQLTPSEVIEDGTPSTAFENSLTNMSAPVSADGKVSSSDLANFEKSRALQIRLADARRLLPEVGANRIWQYGINDEDPDNSDLYHELRTLNSKISSIARSTDWAADASDEQKRMIAILQAGKKDADKGYLSPIEVLKQHCKTVAETQPYSDGAYLAQEARLLTTAADTALKLMALSRMDGSERFESAINGFMGSDAAKKDYAWHSETYSRIRPLPQAVSETSRGIASTDGDTDTDTETDDEQDDGSKEKRKGRGGHKA